MVTKKEKKEQTVEEKLVLLKKLQDAYSQIDAIHRLLEELPLEVEDLKDEIESLDNKLKALDEEVKDLNKVIADKKLTITESESLLEKYNAQLNGIKNNREYDNLKKEIEHHELQVGLAQKLSSEAKDSLTTVKQKIAMTKDLVKERKEFLADRQANLDSRKAEAEAEEAKVMKTVASLEKNVEERLLKSFKRTRSGNKNGLAVVAVDRDACGGCFNKIPAQAQIDVKLRRKILTCEYCGRIIIDSEL